MIRPTADMQLALIKKMESGKDSESSSNFEAPRLISVLTNSSANNSHIRNHSLINEDRLAMALKECFRYSTNLGRDIWDFRRKVFIKDVIETYHLFTEITEILERELS